MDHCRGGKKRVMGGATGWRPTSGPGLGRSEKRWGSTRRRPGGAAHRRVSQPSCECQCVVVTEDNCDPYTPHAEPELVVTAYDWIVAPVVPMTSIIACMFLENGSVDVES